MKCVNCRYCVVNTQFSPDYYFKYICNLRKCVIEDVLIVQVWCPLKE